MGFNYSIKNWDSFHALRPEQPVVISEASSGLRARGVYQTDVEKCHICGIDAERSQWRLMGEEQWKKVAENDYLSGIFVWTGFDYRGEPSPYPWPAVVSNFGPMDLCGFPKDNYYYYQAWWTDRPVLYLCPHWTWPGREGESIDVWCHSNCDEVELFVNGESRGRKKVERHWHLEWPVVYQPGVLEAKGYRGGREIASARIETTGAPYCLRLTADRGVIRADGMDVSMVTVEVLDAEGRLVPEADPDVSFELVFEDTEKPIARILGVGNGNPSSHEADKAKRRRTFKGLAQVIVQATDEAGRAELRGCAPSLVGARVEIRTGAVGSGRL